MKRVHIRVAEVSKRTSPATNLSVGSAAYGDLPSQEQPRLPANTVVATAPQPSTRFERDALPHLDRIYCTALCMTGDHTDAETLVEDVFARAYARFHELRPEMNFRVWLYRILADAFVEGHWQPGVDGDRGSRVRERPRQIGALRRPVGANGVQSHLRGEEVRAALQSLPYDLRIVVYLADVERLPGEAIGQILGVPTAVVESRLRSGHQELCIRLWGRHSPARQVERSVARAPTRHGEPVARCG